MSFEEGTLLWLWYDLWVVVAAFAAMVLMTLLVLARSSWSRVLPLTAKTVAVVATVVVAIEVLERPGAQFRFPSPEAYSYGTVAAAVATLGIGVAMLGLTRAAGAPEMARPTGAGAGGGQPSVGSTRPSLFRIPNPFRRRGKQEPPGAPGAEQAVQTGGRGFEPTEETGATAGPQPPTEAPAQTGETEAAGRTGETRAAEAAPSPPASLVERTGAEAGREHPLTAETVTVGRSRDNAIVLGDATVSRHHCRITRSAHGYQVEDVGSTAGTMVDGTRIVGPTPLRSRSVLRLGDAELAFQGPEAAATGTTAGTEAPTAAAAPQPAAQGGGTTQVMGKEPAAPAWLLVRSGSQAGRSFPLSGERVSIGRGADNGVALEDAAVSRQHAVVTVNEGRFVLRDVGSRGGTRVNGQPLGGLPLREGSRITVGSSELVFSEVEGAQPSAPAGGGETASGHPESRAALLVRSGPSAGRSFPLGEQDVAIGREPGSGGAQLDDASVSRHHALVRRAGERYEVLDLGSANSTFVDGARVEGRELANGDLVTVGQTELQFVKAGTQ